MPPPPSSPGSLPDVLQARLRVGLQNWFKRTFLWGAFLSIFSVQVPFLRAVLVGWIIFSGISLAFLLIGMKLARHLKGGSVVSFGTGGVPPTHGFPAGNTPDEPPPRAPAGGSDEVIEIDTEVLPPESPAPHRSPKAREIHEG